MKLVYCGGGNPTFAKIALGSGWHHGARLPSRVYGPLHFADQDWKHPDRAGYMRSLAEHRPHLATVLDWERWEQRAEVLDWAEEAGQYAEVVAIVPKVVSGIETLPRRVNGRPLQLAYACGSKYGRTPTPLWEFAGWPVHILGGGPLRAMHTYLHLGGISEVTSADGNMANKMAHHCRFWRRQAGDHGHWVQLKEVGLGDWGRDANAESFRRSCENIAAEWRALVGARLELLGVSA